METKGLTRKKLTDYQAIRNYYTSKEEVKLTEHQEQIRYYYQQIKAMLLAGKPIADIVTTVTLDYGVSESTCYRYIKHVKNIFGSLSKADWEFERHFIYEQCKAALVLAKSKGNIKGINTAISNLIKMLPEGADLPDFDKLKQGVYPVILDDPVRDLLMKLLMSPGKTDLTELMNQLGDVEDTEHEEVVD